MPVSELNSRYIACRKMACRKMNQDVAYMYARNTESGCKAQVPATALTQSPQPSEAQSNTTVRTTYQLAQFNTPKTATLKATQPAQFRKQKTKWHPRQQRILLNSVKLKLTVQQERRRKGLQSPSYISSRPRNACLRILMRLGTRIRVTVM